MRDDASRVRPADEDAQELAVAGPRWPTLLAGLRRPRDFLVELVSRMVADRTSTNAAAMSYYFFFALFPFVLFLLALVSLLPAQGFGDWLMAALLRYMPDQGRVLVEQVMRSLFATEHEGLVSVGALLTLWAGSAAFGSIIDGLNQAYRVTDSRPWWRVQLLAIELTLALSVFLILAFVLGVFGGKLLALLEPTLGPAGVTAANVVRWVVTLVLVASVVGCTYYLAPDVEQRWRWVTPGSALFTASFGAASAAFSAYVTRFGSYDATYGSLGAVIILLLWMYLLAFLLLVGAELNALLEHTSPAGKAPGEREQPPVEIQLERVQHDVVPSAPGVRFPRSHPGC